MARILVVLTAVTMGSGCCFQLPEPPKRDAGAPCTDGEQCLTGSCARGFCTGQHCCRDGRGGCSPDCDPGWECSRCTKLFCTDFCQKTCAADADCPATWQCVGSRCQVKPNPTRFLFPDGGFVVRRNATVEFSYEVADAEDDFLDGGMSFRDDSRPEQPLVYLAGQRASYTFGPLDFAGGLQLEGWSRYGQPVIGFAPLVVCREAAEACTGDLPCCEGLACDADAGTCGAP
jgi:hypothetical protein